jgi:hypothetical protein
MKSSPSLCWCIKLQKIISFTNQYEHVIWFYDNDNEEPHVK